MGAADVYLVIKGAENKRAGTWVASEEGVAFAKAVAISGSPPYYASSSIWVLRPEVEYPVRVHRVAQRGEVSNARRGQTRQGEERVKAGGVAADSDGEQAIGAEVPPI